jgi:hypothetical protein
MKNYQLSYKSKILVTQKKQANMVAQSKLLVHIETIKHAHCMTVFAVIVLGQIEIVEYLHVYVHLYQYTLVLKYENLQRK